jgi:hypothetical protein
MFKLIVFNNKCITLHRKISKNDRITHHLHVNNCYIDGIFVHKTAFTARWTLLVHAYSRLQSDAPAGHPLRHRHGQGNADTQPDGGEGKGKTLKIEH